ncbi:MAG: helix-turn-helix domain-containing protein [Oscillospiraceae bacterium]|nr:helix-turn-helix domain-containing protein [Oscillospiraceae bacterium]
MDARIVGEKIIKQRKLLGLTQQELADKLFVSNKTVSKWESGGGLPDTAILPALASALSVSVDDIMAETHKEKQGSRTPVFNKRRVMAAALILLSVLLIVLVIANVLWDRYISDTFDPFLNNKNLQAIPDRSVMHSNRLIVYEYMDYSESRKVYTINMPRRLDFGGNINITTHPHPNDDIDHSLSLTIFMRRGGNWTYALGITDFNEVHVEFWGSAPMRRYSAVDMNGEPLGKSPGDSDEFYNIWLEQHERYYDTIMKFFADMKEFFGEDAFLPAKIR